MFINIKKEVVIVTILFVVVTSAIIYSLIKDFMIYDLLYLITFVGFYVRYLKIKRKQSLYSEM